MGDTLRVSSSILDLAEGACGICHRVLEELSNHGINAESSEFFEGVNARLVNTLGEAIGKGRDITWAPAILKAQIDADIIPEDIATDLEGVLTKRADLKRVAGMSGYGRVVTSAGLIISHIWENGGYVEVKRDGIGVRAIFYDKDGDEISNSVTGFCPVCAINISAGRVPSIRRKIAEKLKGSKNTGKIKYERGILNRIKWKNRRIYTDLIEDDKIIGRNWGCCIAYSTVRAEIAAGLGSKKWNRIFKHYCDQCPLKHCWIGKAMGALGNKVLHRMKNVNVKEIVRMEDYITVDIMDNNKRVGYGIGTLCSLSASVNALMRSDAIKILKPTPAEGFPYKERG
ncbi:MAG TPA: hypothetical protein HA298_01605 [Methanobacteriales archaeon]|nr:MAG: hypothetical protein XD44_0416 [Methanobacteriaceae archaeon 41_258]MBC7096143.1 hypothetical protein [Methanobacteriales archaeon]HIH61370.1 hypothetical protein [Methanobacteriales archaeon]